MTGGSGFISHHLLARLCQEGYSVRVTSRKSLEGWPCPVIQLPEIHAQTEWRTALKGMETVVHLAGLAHEKKTGHATAESYQITNAEGTRRLAEQAAESGVRRLIFLSSIGVLGENTKDGEAFCPSDPANPTSDYARSKWQAEQSLLRLADRTSLRVSILRVPMVYGPGNPGNPLKVLQWVQRQWPIPLRALGRNQRSFLGVSNLVDFFLVCLSQRDDTPPVLHLSDDEDVSTAEFFRRVGKAMGKDVRNVDMPLPILKAGLRLFRRGDWTNKMCKNLKVDIQKTKELFGWSPVVRMEEEMERTARWWRTTGRAA